MKKGKKYQDAVKLVDKNMKYELEAAIALVKKTSYAKFDATVELAFRLDLDPRKAEQNLRGALVLPHGTGKVLRVCVIATGDKAKEAKEAGADVVGDKELLDEIAKGWLEFDVMVATPDMMAQLGKLGRILGTKGLMPNPKTGTVTQDVARAVTEIKNGKVEYRVDKFGNIQAAVGKVSFSEDKLKENIKVFIDQMYKIRPVTVKGAYVKNITLTSTMGPGIKLDLDSLRS